METPYFCIILVDGDSFCFADFLENSVKIYSTFSWKPELRVSCHHLLLNLTPIVFLAGFHSVFFSFSPSLFCPHSVTIVSNPLLMFQGSYSISY